MLIMDILLIKKRKSSMFEIIGSKESRNGKYTVIIERNVNDRRKTIYTIYNNKLGTKRTLTK